jgi:hypothetical protein
MLSEPVKVIEVPRIQYLFLPCTESVVALLLEVALSNTAPCAIGTVLDFLRACFLQRIRSYIT